MADNLPEIGVKMVVDGDKEYKKALADLNRQTTVLTSEQRKLVAQFDRTGGSEEALTAKANNLRAQIENQKKKIDTVNAALQNSIEVYGENSKQADNWRIKLNNAERDLATMQNKLDDTEDELRQFGDAENEAGQNADKVGRGVKDASNQAENGKGKFSAFGETLKKALTVTAIVAGVRKLGQALKSLITDSAAFADDIATTSTNTHIAVQDLQEYAYAANLIDVETETLTGSMAKNIKSMSSAAKGTKAMSDAYKQLGVSVTDSHGNLRDGQTVYWEAIDALGKIEDETKRDAIAMQIFGKSAQDLNSLIVVGSAGVKAYAAEARVMGAVVSETAIEDLHAMQDSMDRMKAASTGWKNTIAAGIAPTVTKALTSITEKVAGIIPKVKTVLSNIVSRVGDLYNKIKKPIDRIIQTLKPIVRDVLEVVKPIVEKIISTTVTGLKSAAPLLKVVWTILKPIVKLIGGLVEATAWVGDQVAGVFNSVINWIAGTDDSLQELDNSIADTSERWSELGEAAENSLSESLGSLAPLEQAKERLGEIFDDTGNLIGNEEEAIRLVGVLTQAGIEANYNPVTKRIEGYADLGKEIDNVIAKTKLQALTDATTDAYEEAIRSQAQLQRDAADAATAHADAVAKYGEDSDEAAEAAARLEEANQNLLKVEQTLSTVETAAGLAQQGDFEGAIAAYEKYYADINLLGQAGVDNARELRQAALQEAVDFVNLYGENLKTGNETLINSAFDGMESAFSAARAQGAKIPESLAQGIKDGSTSLTDALALLDAMINGKNSVDFKASTVTEMHAFGFKLPTELSSGMKEALPKVEAGAKELTNMAKNNTVTQNDLALVHAKGEDYGTGLANGINSPASRAKVKKAANSLMTLANSTLHKVGEFGSPSRFTERHGKWFDEGLIKGIKAGERDLAAESARLANLMKAPLGAPTTNSSKTINITNNNSFTGTNNRDAASMLRMVDRQLGILAGGVI